MSYRCGPCRQRPFTSQQALDDHIRESRAHALSFKCPQCPGKFNTKISLQQHVRNSTDHNPPFGCSRCNKSFKSIQARDQHIRGSLDHTFSFDCEECGAYFTSKIDLGRHISICVARATPLHCADCDRDFDNLEALQMHLRVSQVHKTFFDCGDCVRSFGSEDALQQHLRQCPAQIAFIQFDPWNQSSNTEGLIKQRQRKTPARQKSSYGCVKCGGRSFKNDEALQQHVRDSPSHQEKAETPLDVFFRSFLTFVYDPTLSPSTSYKQLQKHEGFRRGTRKADDAWDEYQIALQSELKLWFGAEDDLTAWHALCRAIGVDPLPNTPKQCEHAARNTHVNIVDLIEWGRSDSEKKLRTFSSVEELATYTKETKKIYLNSDSGGNVVLRHLLRKIFRKGPQVKSRLESSL